MLSTSLTLLSLLASASAYAAPKDNCVNFFVPVSIEAPQYKPLFPPFMNQYEATESLIQSTGRTAPNATSAISGPETLKETFKISVQYCYPSGKGYGNGKSSDTVLLLTHGLGFDKSYWSFTSPENNSPQNYSFTYHAAASSFATLSYDRIGNGLSTAPDPYTVSQAPIELAILTELTKLLRSGKLYKGIPKPTRVVHVGHSYGSQLSNLLAASADASLSDAIVLTGFTYEVEYMKWFAISTGFHILAQNQPKRFAGRSTGYLTWGDKFYNQYSFLTWPYFDPKVLDKAEATKWPFTVGEFLTGGILSYSSPKWKKPVLVRRLINVLLVLLLAYES